LEAVLQQALLQQRLDMRLCSLADMERRSKVQKLILTSERGRSVWHEQLLADGVKVVREERQGLGAWRLVVDVPKELVDLYTYSALPRVRATSW